MANDHLVRMSCSWVQPFKLSQAQEWRPQVCINLCHQPAFTVCDASRVFTSSSPPLGIKRRSKFSFLLMVNVWVRSRGEGQGAHMVKELGIVTRRGANRLPCFLEGQRHQDNYLTSLITSSSPWGHYSFKTGHHFHGELPKHEWRDKDLPLLLL